MSQELFIDAVKKGDLATARHFVESREFSVDTTADNNFAVQVSAENGQLEVLRFLVEEAPKHGQKPVDITAENDRSHCATSLSVLNGHLDILKYLVENAPDYGQKPVDVTKNTNYAVCASAGMGHLPILRYLVEESHKHGQNAVSVSENLLPVHQAIGQGHLDVLKYLVEEAPKHGQSPVEATSLDDFMVIECTRKGHFDILNYLVKEAPKYGQKRIDSNSFLLGGALITAVTSGNFDILKGCMEASSAIDPISLGDVTQNVEPGDSISEKAKINILQTIEDSTRFGAAGLTFAGAEELVAEFQIYCDVQLTVEIEELSEYGRAKMQARDLHTFSEHEYKSWIQKASAESAQRNETIRTVEAHIKDNGYASISSNMIAWTYPQQFHLTIPCKTCNETGKVVCGSCSGKGRVRCSRCHGSGHVTCSSCSGSGQKTTKVTCSRCGGRGYTETQSFNGHNKGYTTQRSHCCSGHTTTVSRCNSCTNGQVTCGTCGGGGTTSCSPCSGTGKVTCPACNGHKMVTHVSSVKVVAVPSYAVKFLNNDQEYVKKAVYDNLLVLVTGKHADCKGVEYARDETKKSIRAVYSFKMPFCISTATIQGASFPIKSFGYHGTILDASNIIQHLVLDDLNKLEALTGKPSLSPFYRSKVTLPLSVFMSSKINTSIVSKYSQGKDLQVITDESSGFVSKEYVNNSLFSVGKILKGVSRWLTIKSALFCALSAFPVAILALWVANRDKTLNIAPAADKLMLLKTGGLDHIAVIAASEVLLVLLVYLVSTFLWKRWLSKAGGEVLLTSASRFVRRSRRAMIVYVLVCLGVVWGVSEKKGVWIDREGKLYSMLQITNPLKDTEIQKPVTKRKKSKLAKGKVKPVVSETAQTQNAENPDNPPASPSEKEIGATTPPSQDSKN
jgi:hypothetical protein